MRAATFKSFNSHHSAAFNNPLKAVRSYSTEKYFRPVSEKEANIRKEDAFLTERQATAFIETHNKSCNWDSVFNVLHSIKLLEHPSVKRLDDLYDDIGCWSTKFYGLYGPSSHNRSPYKRLEVTETILNTCLLLKEISPLKYGDMQNIELSNSMLVLKKSLNLTCDMYNNRESWQGDRDKEQLKELKKFYSNEGHKVALTDIKGIKQVLEAYDKYQAHLRLVDENSKGRAI
jgi:hypothetical protein